MCWCSLLLTLMISPIYFWGWLCLFKKMWSDAKQSHKLYEEAKKAEKSVNDIISSIGTPDEDDRGKLKRAMEFYKGLNPAAVTFFDVMLRKANDDHDKQETRRRREREEEERRRRNSYHSSNYHHHSGGSFGGHGGISHGGGANRHF